ncbi:MAG: 3-hydroxyacyl-ACP dehydratase FabZ [Gammaproteobacteria bacterium]
MLDVNDIKEMLPHRYPFLLVDRVVALEVDYSIEAVKNVSINEPFFTGHFPSHAVMPGVLVIEALAQTCGILGFKTLGKSAAADFLYMIAGVNNARFRRPVVPGDQLRLFAKKVNKKRLIWIFECRAEVEGELAVEAELMVVEKPL